MDVGKIRAQGPWVLVKVDPSEEKYAGSALYKAAGNMEDRMGISTGIVLSVGRGKWSEKGQCFLSPGVEKGERIAFRGFLQEANRPGPLDKEHCFLHQDDVLGSIYG